MRSRDSNRPPRARRAAPAPSNSAPSHGRYHPVIGPHESVTPPPAPHEAVEQEPQNEPEGPVKFADSLLGGV